MIPFPRKGIIFKIAYFIPFLSELICLGKVERFCKNARLLFYFFLLQKLGFDILEIIIFDKNFISLYLGWFVILE